MSGAQNQHSVVVGQRISKPGPTINWQHLARRGQHMLVYEVDDDLFNIHRSSERPYYFYTHPETVDAIENCLQVADLVTVSTGPLAELLSKYNPNVKILPNYIHRDALELPAFPMDLRQPDGRPIGATDLVTVGYTSSPTHADDWNLVRDQLVMLGQKTPNLLYVFIGEQYEIPVPNATVGWIPDINTYYQYLNFDIGIAPLAPTKFNQSKSHIKALEYAARGIPVVASDEPPYREFIQHGVTGFLAKQPYQFGRYLRDLVNDPQMRDEMGANARQQAERWTIQENWRQWADAYCLDPGQADG